MGESQRSRFEVLIEPVRDDELPELASLAARTFTDAFGNAMVPHDLEETLAKNRSVDHFEKTKDSTTILVARHEGKLVGYAQYGDVEIPDIQAGEGDKELMRLYVETELHHKGIGRQLMDSMFADPVVAEAPTIYLQVWDKNEAAIPLYESYGFETVAVTTTPFIFDSNEGQDLIMARHQHS